MKIFSIKKLKIGNVNANLFSVNKFYMIKKQINLTNKNIMKNQK